MRQRIVDHDCGFTHLFPAGFLYRIEVEVKIIGPVHVVAAGIPLIEIDTAEVNDPKQRTEIADGREMDDIWGGMLIRARLDPIRTGLRSTLHEEKSPAGAVRVAFHHHG